MLKRGVRIYEVPISYTGREFDEGKKITWRDGFTCAVDAGQVPVRRLTVHGVTDHRWAAVVVNYEVGSTARRLRADRCSPTTSAGPVELVVVDNGRATVRSLRCVAAAPGVQVVARAGQRRVRAGGEPRHRRNAVRRSSPCLNPDLTLEPGTASALVERFDGDAALGARRAAHPQPRRLRLPLGAPTCPRRSDAVGHGAARAVVARPIRSPCATAQLDADPAQPAFRRLGFGQRDVAAARRARRGRRVGRALLHVHGGRRSVLAAAARRLGGRVRTGRRGGARAGREHAPAPVPDARTSTTVRRGASPAGVSPARGPRCCRSRPCICGSARRHGDGSNTPGARPRPGVPAASLSPMGKASRAKRKRAAVRSAKRSRNNNWWYVLTAFVRHRRHRADRLRARRPSPAPSVRTSLDQANPTNPHNKDSHWHAALGVYDCDHWMGDPGGNGVWHWPAATPSGTARPGQQHECLRRPAQPRRRHHPHGARRSPRRRAGTRRRQVLRVRRLEAVVHRLQLPRHEASRTATSAEWQAGTLQWALASGTALNEQAAVHGQQRATRPTTSCTTATSS